jgi:phage gp16-like protein
MRAQTDDRKRELAAIHVMAARLGLDTADKSEASAYRTMLRERGGASSAAALSAPGRKRVLAHLRECVGPLQAPRPPGGWQAEKIRTLWRQLGDAGVLRDPSERGLGEFVLTQAGVASPNFLDSQQANRVIEALKAWAKRKDVPA